MQKGRICTRESNDVGKRVDFAHPVAAANTWRTKRPRGASGFRAAASQHSEEVRPKCYLGIIRCRPKNSEAMAMRSGAHGGLMCPLEKGVRGIEAGHQMPGRSRRAGKGRPCGDGKPAGPDRPLEKGVGRIKKERAERQGLGQSPNEKTRPRR